MDLGCGIHTQNTTFIDNTAIYGNNLLGFP
jgi:hypothetical protein